MKVQCHFLGVVMAIAIGLLAAPMTGEAKETTANEKINKLLKDRRDTLRQLVELVTEEYRQGMIGYEAVVRASDELIDAELEMAQSRQERMVVLQRRIELMQSLLKMTESSFLVGRGTQADMFAAKAALLKAKIQLAREQEKNSR